MSTVSVTPGSCGIVATTIRIRDTTKVDVLFVVDDSPSMADAQAELAKRAPLLLSLITAPTAGRHVVRDVHLGVITSSLGSYGTSACDPTMPHTNDHAHLLPRVGDAPAPSGWLQTPYAQEPYPMSCPSPIAAASPVAWLYGDANANVATAEMTASCIVEAVADDGCKYQNQLESLYHFLIDPDPWQEAKVDCTFGIDGDTCGTNKLEVTGVDGDLLAERNAFLRPDSALAIVMISDKNDASLKPAQLNWLPWACAKGQMQRGWDGCSKVPDDFEPDTYEDFNTLHATYDCQSCFDSTANPNCALPWATLGLNLDTDDRNLRAFEQTRRFGYNFLWGRKRYVDGLKNSIVPGVDAATGGLVGKGNPIFVGGERTPDDVVVMGLVGVPRDLVRDAPTEDDWAKIVSADHAVRDARMIESIAPRAGRPKYKGSGDTSADPWDGPTQGNGGERDIVDGDDLQYACIAPRTATSPSSECSTDVARASNPLCTPDGNQPYFKAYPSLRELRVLHELGGSALVASICDASYATAMQRLADAINERTSSQCHAAVLNSDTDGRVRCVMEEIFAHDTFDGVARCEDIGPGYCTPGAKPCREDGDSVGPTDPTTAASQLNLPLDVLGADGVTLHSNCLTYSDGTNVYVGGDATNPDCGGDRRLVCEQRQVYGDDRCKNDPSYTPATDDPASGWCYARSRDVIGAQCRAPKLDYAGVIRFVGGVKQHDGSEVYAACDACMYD